MENILYYFNEKVISLVGICLKNSVTEKGNKKGIKKIKFYKIQRNML